MSKKGRRPARIEWASRAVRDLEEVRAFIGRADPATAERFIARLLDRVERASAFPRAGRVVPELDRDDVREVFERPYRIVYRVLEGDGIHVLTVFEAHRLLPPGDVP